MIKFFRKIRYDLMEKNLPTGQAGKTGKYLKYAIGEIILVVIGILIALAINNWNEKRKDTLKQKFILENIKINMKSDSTMLSYLIKDLQLTISDSNDCLKILARNPDVDEQEFKNKFSPILSFQSFNMTTTTFDNAISTGNIELIENEELKDLIVGYYNYNFHKQWDSAMQDYTRNIIAPFLHQFDHVPSMRTDSSRVDISQFDIKPKTVEDYRKELYIINILRSKLWLLEGQEYQYRDLKNYMGYLLTQIDLEIKKKS